jgi:hypothetical protein
METIRAADVVLFAGVVVAAVGLVLEALELHPRTRKVLLGVGLGAIAVGGVFSKRAADESDLKAEAARRELADFFVEVQNVGRFSSTTKDEAGRAADQCRGVKAGVDGLVARSERGLKQMETRVQSNGKRTGSDVVGSIAAGISLIRGDFKERDEKAAKAHAAELRELKDACMAESAKAHAAALRELKEACVAEVKKERDDEQATKARAVELRELKEACMGEVKNVCAVKQPEADGSVADPQVRQQEELPKGEGARDTSAATNAASK